MIDLHTHILPGIDDGPDSEEEALGMAAELHRQGVTKAVCTPHFDPTQTSLEDFLERRAKAVLRMKEAKIDLIPASETFLHDYLFHYADIGALCVENTEYLLLELPYRKKWDNRIMERIDSLSDHYDILPVIAHIDRYPYVKLRHLKAMKELGCIIQMNTSAILDPKTKKKAFDYIRKDYVDVIGSDCHNLHTRPPTMKEAFERIKRELGTSYIEKLDSHALSIINGTELRK